MKFLPVVTAALGPNRLRSWVSPEAVDAAVDQRVSPGLGSTLSRLTGWGQEADTKIASELVPPAPAPAPSLPSVGAETDASNDLCGTTPVALTETATDTSLQVAVAAVVTKVLGGWGLGTNSIRGIAETVAKIVVARVGGLVNDALNDPEIQVAIVNVLKQGLIEAAYFGGGRLGGLAMERVAGHIAERIIQALSGDKFNPMAAASVSASSSSKTDYGDDDDSAVDISIGGLQSEIA
jgi:hypothetical protein